MKLKNNVDSSDLSEAVKEYTIPAQHRVDGVSVPVSLVAEVAPDTDPVQMVPRMSWIYQAQRIATNTNIAGGAIVVDITIAPGQIAMLRALAAGHITTGTHTIRVGLFDEDNAPLTIMGYAGVAAAEQHLYFPSIGTSATATNNSAYSFGLLIPSGAKLSIYQSEASGVANDHVDIGIVLELFNTPTLPTWSAARSTNAAQTTIAASTVSAANTLTVGRIW